MVDLQQIECCHCRLQCLEQSACRGNLRQKWLKAQRVLWEKQSWSPPVPSEMLVRAFVGTSVLVRGKQTGNEISLFLSYLVLGLLFARALDALSLPEQVISKRLFLEVKCMEMATKQTSEEKGKCLCCKIIFSSLPTQSPQSGSDKSFPSLPGHKTGPYYLFICKAFFFFFKKSFYIIFLCSHSSSMI